MTSILLLGCNGQLGFESRQTLAALGDVTALDFPEIDFFAPESLRSLVREKRPDIIVNAAAYTAVDAAESNEEMAAAINSVAPGVLAEEGERLGTIFVHYSTDYVFDGTKQGAYVESDPVRPLSVYGRTKQLGEEAARRCRKHLIFRTSWVVGTHGANFIKTMLRLAAERETLRVVADQVGSPTSAQLLADTTMQALRQISAASPVDPRWGLYHLVSAGETSWNGFARRVIGRAAARGLPLKATPDAVEAITTAEYPTLAKRPANSRMDTSKLRSTFALTLPDWTEDTDRVLERILKEMGQ